MNREKIKELVVRKVGNTTSYALSDIAEFERFLKNPEIRDYLTQCLAVENYDASGVGIASLHRIQEENLEEAAPGVYLFPRGYLVVATSVGGNAICFHESGAVYWFDHASFYDDQVSYKDRSTNEWISEELSDDSVRRAGVLLSTDIGGFLEKLLTDELEDRLDDLD